MPFPYIKIIGRDTALPSPLMAGHPTQKIQSRPPQKTQSPRHPTKSDL